MNLPVKGPLLVILLLLFIHSPRQAEAASPTAMREFIMSCTYGVLAGTLVGAASLAFTEQPGENLNRVARGASLGLYAGIFLGLYVVYIVPQQLERENMDPIGLPPEESASQRLFVYPIISDNGPANIEGIAASYKVLSF